MLANSRFLVTALLGMTTQKRFVATVGDVAELRLYGHQTLID
jgi:hypothetical protein